MEEENKTIIKALNMYGRVPEMWELLEENERLNNIVNGINNYCFKRMAELDDIRERDKKLEDFCDNKINAFLEVREKIKELERR